jgi:hypothetical protein
VTVGDYQPGGALYTPPPSEDTYTPGATLPVSPASPGSGTNWAQAAGVIATDATQLAKPFIQASLPAPSYIQGAYGAQVLYNPQTGQVTQAKQTLPSGLGAPVGTTGVFGSGSTLPLLVILGLAGLLLLGEAKH